MIIEVTQEHCPIQHDHTRRQDVFDYNVVFHFQIKSTGKVWILVNDTDLLVTDDLIEGGIPVSDIVIGFLPEFMRAHSGFAVA